MKTKTKNTVTVRVPVVKPTTKTIPSYRDAVSESTYILHVGRIHYLTDTECHTPPDINAFDFLQTRINTAFDHRTPTEMVKYLRGLASMIERSTK